MGRDTLSQNLGPLHRLQGCGGVDRQCDLEILATQPKLSSKQVRWRDTLALFNVDIRYKPGKENVVPNALSRKHQLKVVYVGETTFQKEVRLGSRCDDFAKERKQKVQKGIKSHFHL